MRSILRGLIGLVGVLGLLMALRIWMAPAAAAGELKLVYQGCSEEAGVCYPPTTRTFRPAADGKAVAPVETVATSFKQQFRKRVSQ